uniref:Uncharacterized protein n=1 Tax=Arundo donax TaxID=35708 RepID=A0A0A9ATY9_ARUDO
MYPACKQYLLVSQY